MEHISEHAQTYASSIFGRPCLFGVPVPPAAFGLGVGWYRRTDGPAAETVDHLIDLTGSGNASELPSADVWAEGARVLRLVHTEARRKRMIRSEVAAA